MEFRHSLLEVVERLRILAGLVVIQANRPDVLIPSPNHFLLVNTLALKGQVLEHHCGRDDYGDHHEQRHQIRESGFSRAISQTTSIVKRTHAALRKHSNFVVSHCKDQMSPGILILGWLLFRRFRLHHGNGGVPAARNFLHIGRIVADVNQTVTVQEYRALLHDQHIVAILEKGKFLA